MIARRVPIAVIALALVACGGNARTRTLRTALASADAAVIGFESWDRDHQLDIVDRAETREAAEASLAAYRAEREKVVLAFEAAYRAIAAAALDPDEGDVTPVIDAVQAAYRAVQALRGSP